MISIDQLAYFAVSHIGLKRIRNEDAYMVYDSASVMAAFRKTYLFGIADGMGGHPCGDKASSMACNGLKVFFTDCLRQSPKSGRNASTSRFASRR